MVGSLGLVGWLRGRAGWRVGGLAGGERREERGEGREVRLSVQREG